jgi:kanamycin kinase
MRPTRVRPVPPERGSRDHADRALDRGRRVVPERLEDQVLATQTRGSSRCRRSCSEKKRRRPWSSARHYDADVEDPFAELALLHTLDGLEMPQVVRDLAGGHDPALVWRNELDGLTFRIGDRFIKWNPRSTGIDLERERVRLDWLSTRHPAPRVLDHGSDHDGQWLVTGALPGGSAVGDEWRARRPEAIRAIATGLHAIHAIPIESVPDAWTAESWVGRQPESLGPRPPIDDPVLVHGDACAPNTLISEAGDWTGNVDFGDLAVGDRWADLAIASLSLDWNFGEGHQAEFFEAYGIALDEDRIRYYRALWELES